MTASQEEEAVQLVRKRIANINLDSTILVVDADPVVQDILTFWFESQVSMKYPQVFDEFVQAVERLEVPENERFRFRIQNLRKYLEEIIVKFPIWQNRIDRTKQRAPKLTSLGIVKNKCAALFK